MNGRAFSFVAVALVALFAIFELRTHHSQKRTAEPASPKMESVDPAREVAAPSSGAAAPMAAPSPGNSAASVVRATQAPRPVFITGTAMQKRAATADPQLRVVKRMIRDYRAALGENPIGNNFEITKALLGANSRRAKFIAAEARLNGTRQLVDRWDHPYFFHQVSAREMEVRSAGPDGVMWTADDEVSL